MTVLVQCKSCGKIFNLEVKATSYDSYCRGMMHAQDAFPELTPAERELLISGLCGECWDALFDDEDDE